MLLLPWLINSLISLMFNATAIAITLYVSLSSKSANYTAVIPFVVTSIVVFGKKKLFIEFCEANYLNFDLFLTVSRYLCVCLPCNSVAVPINSTNHTKQRIFQFNRWTSNWLPNLYTLLRPMQSYANQYLHCLHLICSPFCP